jgi:hypothetical protein
MAYMLFTGEILETLRNLNVRGAGPLIDQLHRITDEAATLLAARLGVSRDAVSELWDFKASVTFHPGYPGQPLPEALAGFDDETEWDDTLEEET